MAGGRCGGIILVCSGSIVVTTLGGYLQRIVGSESYDALTCA